MKDVKNEYIDTGFDLGIETTGSVVFAKAKFYVELVKKAIEKKTSGYIEYPLLMNTLIGLDKFPDSVNKVILKLLPKKIRPFLEKYQQLPAGGERVSALLRSWIGFRMMDDPIDGDGPKKLSAQERVRFIEERLDTFESEEWDMRYAADILCKDALEHAEKAGIKNQLKQGLLLVLESMQFDAGRMAHFLETGERQFILREILEKHYFDQDTEGTGLGMWAILDEPLPGEETRSRTAMLSKAIRIYYDIRDLKKEVVQGFVNIPKEDAEQFGIEMDSLVAFAESDVPLEQAPSEIREWIFFQIQEAQELLQEAESLSSETSEYKELTQLVLRSQYHRAAKKYLDTLEEKLK